MSPNYPLSSNDDLTLLAHSHNLYNWNDLTKYVKGLPYGRNTDRADFSLVLIEQKGTCSSKHALLKSIADLNQIPNVNLILGMYEMNATNTPKIGNVIELHSLPYLPEAHCYLEINGHKQDFTTGISNFDNLVGAIIQETIIAPWQVVDFKVQYQKEYIKSWILENNLRLTFNEVWDIREKCITLLSSPK